MFQAPREFVVQNVLPNYRAFFEHRSTGSWGENQLLRLAINACVALYHLHEHLPTAPSAPELEAICPEFGLVRDITNVAKHGVLDRGRPRISTAGQLTEYVTHTEYQDADGTYWCHRVDVRVKLDDGSVRDVAAIIHAVMVMWCTELDRLGIISLRMPTDDVSDAHVGRAEAGARENMLQLTAGEAAKLQMRVLRFNYGTNVSEPVDLTGSKIKMRFYAPPTRAPIQMTISKPGFRDVILDYDVPLSPEQGTRFMRLGADPEKQMHFVHEVVKADPAIAAGLHAAMAKGAEDAWADASTPPSDDSVGGRGP